MAIPRGKGYYVSFPVYDLANPPNRISGILSNQFLVLASQDNSASWGNITTSFEAVEIGTSGRYRGLVDGALTNCDRLSLQVTVPGNTNAYIPPIDIYFAPALDGVLVVSVIQNQDKTGYALTSAEHTAIQNDVQSGMTTQGYTTARAPKLDNLDVAVSTRPTAADIWNHTTRTLTSFGTLVSNIWSHSSRSLTSLGNTLVDEIWNRLRNAVARPEGSFGAYLDAEISSRPTAADIWNHTTRTLTSFGTLVSDIWSHTTRTITDASNIATAVWSATSRTLTSFGTLAQDVATAVWSATSRTLTSFGTLAQDVATAVWSATSRTLTSFGTLAQDVATAVWGATTRTLTSFGTLVQDTTTAVWTAVLESVGAVSYSAGGIMRLLLSYIVGNRTRSGTQFTFYAMDDTTTRISGTVDADENRTVTTRNGG